MLFRSWVPLLAERGVEGSLVYAVSHLLRDEIEAHGHATFHLDLLPDHSPERVLVEVRHPRGSRSLSSHLKSRLGLDGIKAGILYEHLGKDGMNDPVALAHAIKALEVLQVHGQLRVRMVDAAGHVAEADTVVRAACGGIGGTACGDQMLVHVVPAAGAAEFAQHFAHRREFLHVQRRALARRAREPTVGERGQRTGPQQQRRVGGFHRGHAAGNLHAATADFGSNFTIQASLAQIGGVLSMMAAPALAQWLGYPTVLALGGGRRR